MLLAEKCSLISSFLPRNDPNNVLGRPGEKLYMVVVQGTVSLNKYWYFPFKEHALSDLWYTRSLRRFLGTPVQLLVNSNI